MLLGLINNSTAQLCTEFKDIINDILFTTVKTQIPDPNYQPKHIKKVKSDAITQDYQQNIFHCL